VTSQKTRSFKHGVLPAAVRVLEHPEPYDVSLTASHPKITYCPNRIFLRDTWRYFLYNRLHETT